MHDKPMTEFSGAPSPLRRSLDGLEAAGNGVATVANAVGSLVVLGLVAVVNFDVGARGLFNAPFHGAVEVVQFSMVLVVFLQLPDVVRVGRLTRSDGFLLLLSMGAHNRLARRLNRAIEAVSAVFMALIAITLWPDVVEMWHTNNYFGVPGVFTAPWWPIKLVICASAALCALLFALRALRGRMPGAEGTPAQPSGSRA